MSDPAQSEITRIRGKQSELHAIKRVLLSPDGRTLCNYLLKTYCMTTTYDDKPERAGFKEGQRALAMQLVGTAYKPDRFAQQINELLAQIETQEE